MADAARRFVATVKDDAAMPSDREISRRGSVPNAPRRASVGVMQTPKNRRFSLLGRRRTIAAPSINELHIISSDGPQPLLAVPVGSTSALWAVPKGTDPGQLMQPRTVLAHKGALVVTDLRNGRVEAFHPRTGAHIRTIRRIPAPVGLTVLDDYLYVTSWSDHKVHKIRLVHLVPGVAAQEVAAWGGHGIASRQFKCPTGIATVNGELCIVDRRNHRLTFLTTEGEFVRSIGSKGSQPGQFLDPFGVKEHLGVLYVVDAGNSRVQVLTPQGALLDVLTVQDASANLRDLDVSADGKRIYVADRDHNCIHELERATDEEREERAIALKLRREADEIFDSIDVDGSRTLDIDEIKGHFDLKGGAILADATDHDLIEKLCQILDLDGDGLITRDEFYQGFSKFMRVRELQSMRHSRRDSHSEGQKLRPVVDRGRVRYSAVPLANPESWTRKAVLGDDDARAYSPSMRATTPKPSDPATPSPPVSSSPSPVNESVDERLKWQLAKHPPPISATAAVQQQLSSGPSADRGNAPLDRPVASRGVVLLSATDVACRSGSTLMRRTRSRPLPVSFRSEDHLRSVGRGRGPYHLVHIHVNTRVCRYRPARVSVSHSGCGPSADPAGRAP